LNTFFERGKDDHPVVLPVILSGNDSEFPGFLKRVQWLDMRDISILSMFKTSPRRRPVQWTRAIADIAEHLSQMIKGAPRFNPDWTIRSVSQTEPPADFDIEKAKEMIIEGHAPPEAWQPYITDLSLYRSAVTKLSPLAGLTNLNSLNLLGTRISDLTPLSGLVNLHTLVLEATWVRDLQPIAGLVSLRHLDLQDTPVSDIAPLAHLAALRILNLQGTQVRNLRRYRP
jgi:Leucine-rich repeat (LRR) protein